MRGSKIQTPVDKEGAKAGLTWLREHYDRKRTGSTSSARRAACSRSRRRHPPHPQLPRRLLRACPGHQWADDGGDHPRQPRHVLRVHGRVQARGRRPDAGRDAEVRRARVRVARRHRVALRRGRPRRPCQVNQLFAQYVLDSISTGVAIAFAMECYEHGILTKADTGGIELDLRQRRGRSSRWCTSSAGARGSARSSARGSSAPPPPRTGRRTVRAPRQGAGAADARPAREEGTLPRLRAVADGRRSHGGARTTRCTRASTRPGHPLGPPGAHRAGEDARPRAAQGAGLLLHAAGLELLQRGGDVRLRGRAAERAAGSSSS